MPARIMIVEDYPSMASIMARVLQQTGYEVSCFESAEAALAAFEREHFDLVISDILLPGMDGMELMRTLRALKPIPGIAISGDLEKDECVSAGFATHLLKPVKFDVLIETVARVLADHAAP